jgi:DNA polymerase
MFVYVSAHGLDPQPVLTTLISPTPQSDAAVVEIARGAEPLAIRNIRQFELSPYMPALSTDPQIAVNQVKDRYLSCARCHLAESRNYIVFTRGNLYSPVLALGEGPGREEDKKGVPFIGRSGRLQSELFREAGLDPDRDIAWANIIGCRPVLDRWSGDRPPTEVEKLACSERLLLLLHAIRPRVVICLGQVATTAFFAEPPPLYRWIGPVASTIAPEDWVIFAHVPHPAGLLRTLASPFTYAKFKSTQIFFRELKAKLPTLQKVASWPFGVQYVDKFLAEGKPMLGKAVAK